MGGLPLASLAASLRSAAGSRPFATSPMTAFVAARASAREIPSHEPSGMRRLASAIEYWAR